MPEVITLTNTDKFFGNILTGIAAIFVTFLLIGFVAVGLKMIWKLMKILWESLDD